MSQSSRLPAALSQRFSVAAALGLGVTAGRLRGADLERPFYGVRSRVSAATLADHCLDYAARLRPGQFISHETALALHGAPTPQWPFSVGIHVSAYRPASAPRTDGVHGHRLQTRVPATWSRGGLVIESPVRAWRQTGTLWAIDDLIAAGDFLVSGARPLATLEQLRAEVEIMGDVRGRMLSRALRDVRCGVRSPRETRLRLSLVRAGLPEPDVAWDIRSSRGEFIAEADLAYPRYRVAVEYDGRVHADDPRQFAKDADRWDAIRAAGWDHVRILKHHMDQGIAVHKVVTALRAAGWRS